MRKNRHKAGFTILEIVIATTILAVVMMTVLLLVVKVTHTYYTASAINELSNNGSFALDELMNELRESRQGMITFRSMQDPSTGELHDIVAFATARDSSGTFQKDMTTGLPLWQGIIVYYPFRTAGGINQLRKYVYYNSSVSTGDFPLGINITANTINLTSPSKGALAFFNRTTGATRILANNIATEDQDLSQNLTLPDEDDGAVTQPPDNADGVLDTGINYTQNGRLITAKLFLRKQISIIGGLGQRFVTITLNTSVALRN